MADKNKGQQQNADDMETGNKGNQPRTEAPGRQDDDTDTGERQAGTRQGGQAGNEGNEDMERGQGSKAPGRNA